MSKDLDICPPSISVIMAVHNGEPYLLEAIDSVFGQTFSDFEFIIVDDASNDRTADILGSYEDSRLRIVTLATNVGLAEALNIALEYSQGEFVARMDADDVAYPQRFEKQVATLRMHPEVVLLGSYYDLIGKNGVKFGEIQVLDSLDSNIRCGLPHANQFCHPSVMMRCEVVKGLGGYRSLAGRYAQDYDLWLRMAEKGKLMNLPQSLLKYRVHEGQISVEKALAQRSAAELYKILASQRRLWGREDVGKARWELKQKYREIQTLAASDLLRCARNFEMQGLLSEGRLMKWRAFFVAPFNCSLYRLFARSLRDSLSRLVYRKP